MSSHLYADTGRPERTRGVQNQRKNCQRGLRLTEPTLRAYFPHSPYTTAHCSHRIFGTGPHTPTLLLTSDAHPTVELIRSFYSRVHTFSRERSETGDRGAGWPQIGTRARKLTGEQEELLSLSSYACFTHELPRLLSS